MLPTGMADEESEENRKTEKTSCPHWRKKRWRLLALLLGFLIWLDGPGWRLIGEKAAQHYVPGLTEAFELSGRLSGGQIGIANFNLGEMGEIEVVGLDQASLNYKLTEITEGKVQSLKLQGLHASIDLARSKPKEEKEDEAETERTDIAELLNGLRAHIVPMEIELRDISAKIRRGDKELFQIEPTSLIHSPASPIIELKLGKMTILGDKIVEAQTSTIEWQEESIQLSSLEIMPALEIRDVLARFPQDKPISFATGLVVDGVRFNAESDLTTATLEKEAAPLLVHQAAEKLGFPIPADVTLESLKLTARHLSGGTDTLEADLQLSTSDASFDDWTSSSLAIAAKLERSTLKAAIHGEALGSPLGINAEVPIDRANGLLPELVEADFTILNLEKSLTVVRDRFKPSEHPIPPPASSLKGSARLSFANAKADKATSSISIVSSENAPPITIEATWQNPGDANAKILIPGIRIDGTFTPEANTYSGNAEIKEFNPESLKDWLLPFDINLPSGMDASLTWKGRGDLEENTHEGDLEITSFQWKPRADEQPIKAFATATYSWPESVQLTPLNVQQAEQKIEGDVTFKDQVLLLRKLSWSDGDDTLLNGTATIPVPDDLSNLKALMRETRPINVSIASVELPLSKLHPFLPEQTRFRNESRAKLDINLTGSMAEPVLDAHLVASDLGLSSQPDIPTISIDLKTIGRDKTLKVEGDITSPEYPPMRIDAVTNWSPDQWAADPEVIKQAKLDASAKISDFNLELVKKFLPDARELKGNVNLDLEVTGTVGDPKPTGTIMLNGAALEMQDPTLPRFKDGSMKVLATPDKITLEKLEAVVAGGTLAINGGLDLVEGKPSNIEISIKGNALPAIRDESMIVRLNTDISIRGPWETATISGKVGVVDSLFYKDIEILPIGVPFNQPSEPSLPSVDTASATEPTEAVPAPFRNWSLNMRLVTESPFLIRGNLATGQVFLKVDVTGTIGKPRPKGEATIWKAEAKLPFSTLNIEKGTVEFRPDAPFDPVLNIRGESTIRPYEVKIYIYGPVSNPKVLPTSNPPLPETEIMTLVATGTTTSGFTDPEAATARAAQLLIEEIRNGRVKYVKSLGPLLKVIEKVDFQVGEKDPYTSTKYNSATINLDDNWLIRAGISDEGNTRTTLIYLFRFR